MFCFLFLQLTTAPSVREMGWHALKSVLSGATIHVAKPVLATEVRRIMPTAAGLPMELSLYTAAVAAAAVQSKGRGRCVVLVRLFLFSSNHFFYWMLRQCYDASVLAIMSFSVFLFFLFLV